MKNPQCTASHTTESIKRSDALSRLFLFAFLGSCFWFWWLLSIVYRWVLGLEDPVTDDTIILSIVSAGFFIFGFLLIRIKNRRPTTLTPMTLDRCERRSYNLVLFLCVPSIVIASLFYIVSAGKAYAEGGNINIVEQVIFYLELFFGFMFLGVVGQGIQHKRRTCLVIFLLLLPRVVVSLHWGRAFVAQGFVPILFIAVGRGFIRLSWKSVFQIVVLGLAILIVPSITRGDQVFDSGEGSSQDAPQVVSWLASGSSLQVTQMYLDMDLSHRCPPLLISLTDKVIPYALLHICTIDLFSGVRSANLNRLVSEDLNQSMGLGVDATGSTGTSYLLELFLTGGMPAVVLGSLVFGAVCRFLTTSMASRSLFSGIWAQCLMAALLSPRGLLGYVFEKVPGQVLATLLFMLVGSDLWRSPSPFKNDNLKVSLACPRSFRLRPIATDSQRRYK
jgi:hypothetical protein